MWGQEGKMVAKNVKSRANENNCHNNDRKCLIEPLLKLLQAWQHLASNWRTLSKIPDLRDTN